MNKIYGKIVNGEFIAAKPVREELPDGRGFTIKYLSDADFASGEYKEVLLSGSVPANAEALTRAGRIILKHVDIGNYIIRSCERVIQ
jgi:hypothetical protein